MKTPESTSESENIRSDIEQTRESMDRTLDKIGERITPRHLLDQVLDFFRSHSSERSFNETAGSVMNSVGKTAGRAANGVMDVVKRHPVPTVLIGAGITWAIIEARRSNGVSNDQSDVKNQEWDEADELSESEVEAVPKMAAQVGEKVSSGMATAKQKVKEKSQQFGRRISESARAVGNSAQRGYQAGRTKFVDASDAHPIAVGAGFMAAGILLGLALPPSGKEDRLIGQTSDRTKEQAKAKAQDLIERGKHVASAATQAAKDQAAQEGLTGQSA